MSTKNTLFVILTLLVGIDILFTNIFVIFYGATEINPLCISFSSFMIIKIVVSIILLYIDYKIKNVPIWTFSIIILIIVYSIVLFFNLNNVVNYFF